MNRRASADSKSDRSVARQEEVVRQFCERMDWSDDVLPQVWCSEHGLTCPYGCIR